MEAKTRSSNACSNFPSGSRSTGEGSSHVPNLKSCFTDSERTRWQKLSSDKPFTTSSPPYLCRTVDPKLLEAANVHCTNKARYFPLSPLGILAVQFWYLLHILSMLRIQHQSQNTIQPNKDINKTIKKNRNFGKLPHSCS